jgi:hypothetical protein
VNAIARFEQVIRGARRVTARTGARGFACRDASRADRRRAGGTGATFRELTAALAAQFRENLLGH